MFGFSRFILKTLHKIAPERDFYWSAHSETIYHWTRARAARPAVYGFTMRRSETQKLFPILCSARGSGQLSNTECSHAWENDRSLALSTHACMHGWGFHSVKYQKANWHRRRMRAFGRQAAACCLVWDRIRIPRVILGLGRSTRGTIGPSWKKRCQPIPKVQYSCTGTG